MAKDCYMCLALIKHHIQFFALWNNIPITNQREQQIVSKNKVSVAKIVKK
jgi:hypothetical protein